MTATSGEGLQACDWDVGISQSARKPYSGTAKAQVAAVVSAPAGMPPPDSAREALVDVVPCVRAEQDTGQSR
ncbi:hypothetical protein GCM10010349_01920 [Streptomyces flavofungini]|nr:hypothetical protein GCM10010349_01920 [Streptomyces flavofungini]